MPIKCLHVQNILLSKRLSSHNGLRINNIDIYRSSCSSIFDGKFLYSRFFNSNGNQIYFMSSTIQLRKIHYYATNQSSFTKSLCKMTFDNEVQKYLSHLKGSIRSGEHIAHACNVVASVTVCHWNCCDCHRKTTEYI